MIVRPFTVLAFVGSLVTTWVVPAAAADPYAALDLLRPPKLALAPDFNVPALNAGRIGLRDQRGHPVFLNFWATWCKPCEVEMPAMERLYRRYKDRGFTIIAISIDTAPPSTVAAFVKNLGLTFPIGLDPKLEVADRYTVRALPSSFLIDKDGNTVGIAIGPREWDGIAAYALVESLLK